MSQDQVQSIGLTFSLDDFEHWVNEKSYLDAERALSGILNHVRQGYPLQGAKKVHTEGSSSTLLAEISGLAPFHSGMTVAETRQAYTRLAQAITALLSDKAYVPSANMLKEILGWKNYLREIFACSELPNMDHILVNLGLFIPGQGLQLTADRQDFIRFLMCYTLDSSIDVDFTLFFRFDPELATRAYLGMLNDSHRVLDRRSEAIRNYLLQIHQVLDAAVLDDAMVQNCVPAWMLCTYADFSERHEFKRSLNRAIERWLKTKLPVGLYKRADRNWVEGGSLKNGKPVVVVCGEVLRSSHAMFRNFEPTFRTLKFYFYTILVADSSSYNSVTAEVFDQVCPVSCELGDIKDTVQTILKLRPAAVYYPSLGMAAWTVAICNMRLARLQVMSAGHPASSMSAHIDYFLTNKREANIELDARLFSEKILQTMPRSRPNQLGQLLAKHPDVDKLSLRDRTSDGVIRLAVNSSLMKISPSFVQACQLIATQSSVPVEFHFFIAERGIRVDSAHLTLANMLPCVYVYGLLPYGQYMQLLSKCDLALGTFPFGGATTNTDLVSLGIPKINMVAGLDLSGHTDFMFWKNVGVDFIFFADNELNYVASAIYVIHNRSFLEAQSELLMELARDGKALKSLEPEADGSDSPSLPFAIRFAESNSHYESLLERARHASCEEGQMLEENTFVEGTVRTKWHYMLDEVSHIQASASV